MHEVDDRLQICLAAAQVCFAYFVFSLPASSPAHLPAVDKSQYLVLHMP